MASPGRILSGGFRVAIFLEGRELIYRLLLILGCPASVGLERCAQGLGYARAR